jgi:hypothetical protein
MGAPVARVNYQRDKRLKDLDRQRKQEEKRNRKLHKDASPQTTSEVEGSPEAEGLPGETPEETSDTSEVAPEA